MKLVLHDKIYWFRWPHVRTVVASTVHMAKVFYGLLTGIQQFMMRLKPGTAENQVMTPTGYLSAPMGVTSVRHGFLKDYSTDTCKLLQPK